MRHRSLLRVSLNLLVFVSVAAIVGFLAGHSASAQETKPTSTPASAANSSSAKSGVDRPIQALLVTGGCCHDYARQKLILTRGISARANVRWTVVHQGGATTNAKIPLYENPDWSKGFDVVVHNECFSDVKDTQWVDNILKPHREGLPAVLIHCAMHCYRTGDDRWFEFVGMQSPGHGAHYPFTVEPLSGKQQTDAGAYILRGFDKNWTVPKGELYHSMKLWTSAVPLALAKRQSDGKPQICVWTNQYRKGRVFGTTIGHYNETMAEPQYLDMVTRGLLWAAGRGTEDAFKTATEQVTSEIKELVDVKLESGASVASGPCCGEGNAAHNRPANASSEEKSKGNLAPKAVDGDLQTRWCAAGGSPGQWWEVDLGSDRDFSTLRIHWEMPDVAYRYKIFGAKQGGPDAEEKEWAVLVDQSENKARQQVAPHAVKDAKARYIRVEFLGSSSGAWGSIREFEVYDGDAPPAPKVSLNSATINDVQAPSQFDVTMFGAPPLVNYPVCLTAAPNGEVFVGVDEQGSLGKEPGRGKILRCVDADGDGRAEQVNTFATVDHPRGLIYDAGKLWVLHPPTLSLFVDEDLDGVADRQETLIEGISTDQVNRRGADHTTNGIRMGIDGWIYIAVGDFGFTNARGKDGATLGRRGGGVVRVRPDGSHMEIYAWGLRNIVDVCIDPYMNLFTRDNTNDGGGWNVRLSHILQSANYGYPSLYLNFTDEIMPTLRDYGGGSGCGGMFLSDARWPGDYAQAAYTCDWGRSEVYRHNLPANGATFDAHQEVFAKIPHPTDIDVDGSGRMYVSSWKNGSFSYSGPDVGFVARITPQGFVPPPFPNLATAKVEALIQWLSAPSSVYRLHSQQELVRRARLSQPETLLKRLATHAADQAEPLFGRVAAIFAMKQIAGQAANPQLVDLAKTPEVREFALRALTDRKDQLASVSADWLSTFLTDENPRVVAQAVISLGRLGENAAPEVMAADRKLLSLAMPVSWSDGDNSHALPNPAAVIPHLAVKALVARNAVAASLEMLDGPLEPAALRTLNQLHSPKVVDGLVKALNNARSAERRQRILAALMRLYYREGDYESGWWGTRPDRTGPYYDRQTWQQSERIGAVLKTAIGDASPEQTKLLSTEMQRHQVKISGLDLGGSSAGQREPGRPIVIQPVDANDPNQIGNLGIEHAITLAQAAKAGDSRRGRDLFTSQSCAACHTVADGQTPKGPHLVDIGKRYKRSELIESLLKPSAKIAQGFDTYALLTSDGKVVTGFVVGESAETLRIRKADGVVLELAQDEIERRTKLPLSMMPQGIVNNLTIEQLADLLAYLDSLRTSQ